MGSGIRLGTLALVGGFATAALVGGLPALAADHSIAAQSDNTWKPSALSIPVGDSVTFTNDGGFHNVCVSKPGSPQSACDEFRNGDASVTWATYTNSHAFKSPGTYSFICEVHAASGMTGTITVTAPSTSTGTGTTQTQSQTQTTQTQTSPADTTAPGFTSRPKRRASRKSIILDFGSSEDGTLEATVFRRPPRARSFKRVGSTTVDVHEGRNVVTLPRTASGRLRSGAYRVRLVLVDAAGNRSAAHGIVFKLP